MRHRLLKPALRALVFAALGLGIAQAAEAGTISVVRDGTKYSGNPSGLGAGEFGVSSFAGSSLGTLGTGVAVGSNIFHTFCLETTEPISMSTSYSWTIGTGATGGGYSGGNPDPLDARTAYLVSKFWHGQLSGYVYTPGSTRVASATSLQLAIWQLEGELQPGILANAYNSDSQAQAWVSAANTAVSNGTWSGLGNVRVLNLFTAAGEEIQSLVVEIGDVVTPIPLPPSALLGLSLMAGLAGVGAVMRTRRRSLA